MKNKSKLFYLNISVISLFTILFILPYYTMIIGSFKSNRAFIQIPPDLFPTGFITDNYRYLATLPVFRWFGNSLFSSIVVTILTLVFASAAAYSFAKKNFIGKKVLFSVVIFTLIMPRQIFIVPSFILTKNLGLYDNIWGIIIPCIATPFSVFLLRQFMMTLPGELIDAARIDGCKELMTFTKIILPLSKPALGALAIFSFVNIWNDFFWQLLILSSKVNKTVPLGIANMIQEKVQNYGYQMAGAVAASIPMLIVYLIFQRNFIGGITMGAVKG